MTLLDTIDEALEAWDAQNAGQSSAAPAVAPAPAPANQPERQEFRIDSATLGAALRSYEYSRLAAPPEPPKSQDPWAKPYEWKGLESYVQDMARTSAIQRRRGVEPERRVNLVDRLTRMYPNVSEETLRETGILDTFYRMQSVYEDAYRFLTDTENFEENRYRLAAETNPKNRRTLLGAIADLRRHGVSGNTDKGTVEVIEESVERGILRTAGAVEHYLNLQDITDDQREFAAQLLDIRNSLDPPINPKKHGWLTRSAAGAAESTPMMAMGLGVAAVGGSAAGAIGLGAKGARTVQVLTGMATWGTGLYPEEYESMRAAGLDLPTSKGAAVLSAAVQGAIETWEFNPFGSGLKVAVREGLAALAKRSGKQFLKAGAKEWGEEWAQATTHELTKYVATRLDVAPDSEAYRSLQNILRQGIDSAGPVLMMVGGGHAGGAAIDAAGQYSANREMRVIDTSFEILKKPEVTQRVAEMPESPSRQDFQAAGISGVWSSKQRAAIVNNVKMASRAVAEQRAIEQRAAEQRAAEQPVVEPEPAGPPPPRISQRERRAAIEEGMRAGPIIFETEEQLRRHRHDAVAGLGEELGRIPFRWEVQKRLGITKWQDAIAALEDVYGKDYNKKRGPVPAKPTAQPAAEVVAPAQSIREVPRAAPPSTPAKTGSFREFVERAGYNWSEMRTGHPEYSRLLAEYKGRTEQEVPRAEEVGEGPAAPGVAQGAEGQAGGQVRVRGAAEGGVEASAGEGVAQPPSSSAAESGQVAPGEEVEPEVADYRQPKFGPVGFAADDITVALAAGWRGAKKLLHGLFTSPYGKLPKAVRPLWDRYQGNLNARLTQASYDMGEFNLAAKQAYGGWNKMGLENSRLVNRVFSGQELYESLPEVMRAPVKKFREHVDAMSQEMIDLGIAQGKLAIKFDENKGIYVHRSYNVYTDPRHAEKVPEEIRNKAKALLRSEFEARETKKEERAARRGQQYERKELAENQLDHLINWLLFEGKAADSPMRAITKGKLGHKDLSILKKRVLNSPELRALYGEHQDALVNYVHTVAKMAHLIASHEFLTEVREAGMGRFFWEMGNSNIDPNAAVRIAAKGSETMSPLNGLYTYPEVRDAFENILGKVEFPEWYRAYLKANAGVKIAKTSLSWMTSVRNYLAGPFFNFFNGHWLMPRHYARSAVQAHQQMIAGARWTGPRWTAAVHAAFGENLEGFREAYLDAVRHHVVRDSVHAGELLEMIKDSARGEFGEFLANRGPLAKVGTVAGGFYRAQDEVWKIMGWMCEQMDYALAYPEWSAEQVKAHTAEIIRNGYQTYSRVPDIIRRLRRFPAKGMFVGFYSEVLRTSANTMALTAKELANPRTRFIGARRLAGMISVAIGSSMLAALSRFIYGVTRDRVEAMRKFLPDWSVNSDLLVFGRNAEGKWAYIDLSYADPYSSLKKPLTAFMRGEDWESSLRNAGAAFFQPFLTPELFWDTLIDIDRNRTAETNRSIYNPEAPIGDQVGQIMFHLLLPFEPGTVTSGRRILNPKYSTKRELFANLLGVRQSVVDLKTGLYYRTREYVDRMANANRMATDPLNQKIPDNVALEMWAKEKLVRGWEQSEIARKAIQDEQQERISAARLLGTSDEDIEKEIRRGGVSEAEAGRMLAGARITSEQMLGIRMTEGDHPNMNVLLKSLGVRPGDLIRALPADRLQSLVYRASGNPAKDEPQDSNRKQAGRWLNAANYSNEEVYQLLADYSRQLKNPWSKTTLANRARQAWRLRKELAKEQEQ